MLLVEPSTTSAITGVDLEIDLALVGEGLTNNIKAENLVSSGWFEEALIRAESVHHNKVFIMLSVSSI